MKIDDIKNLLRLLALFNNNVTIDTQKSIFNLYEDVKKLEYNTLMDLLNSDAWPYAVDPDLICNPDSEEDKYDRAHAIIENIFIDFKNKNFLDFGCGEGHLAEKICEYNVNSSCGYDIKDQNWSNRQPKSNLKFTTELNDIKDKFDIILMYDILDHTTDPITTLKQAKNLLLPNGQIFVVCHPWCSKHGSHLYYKLNKAYVHLIFTEDELKQMGHELIFTRKSIHPLGDYYYYFEQARLSKIYENIKREDVDNFFMQPVIANRIRNNWSSSPDNSIKSGIKFPSFQMEQQICEFLLRI